MTTPELTPNPDAKRKFPNRRPRNLRDRVQGALADKPLSPATYPWYEAFAAEVANMQRRYTDSRTILHEVAVIFRKWVARGLDQHMLDHILDCVLSLPMDIRPKTN